MRLVKGVWLVWLIVLFPVNLQADYMSPDLRQQVEQLKEAVQNAPTTLKTYRERSQIAWKWLNAWAMNGGNLPVNITAVIGRSVLPRWASRRSLPYFDFYVRELTLLDEQPGALGKLAADTGPFEARDWVTLEQTWTVGDRPVVTGGGLLIARHFMPGYRFQVDDPAGDNYLSIRSSNAGVRFVPATTPYIGMHGGFRGAAPARVFRVESGSLNPGDTVTITYGDTSGGGRGFRMVSMSTDFLPLPIYVDFDGSDDFFTLPIQPVRVVGTVIDAFHGFAPSVVRPGESFALSVRAQDRFYNRAKPPVPAFKVYANDQLLVTGAKSDRAITVFEGLKFAEPGVYRISIISKDGSIRGVGNPVLVSEDASRLFWGDTHGHSGFAEGIGTPDRFMQWAKEDARLDFVTHSEHDIWMDDREWHVLMDNVKKYSEPGRFVAYLGYEWTVRNDLGGHHNVLFRSVDAKNRIATQFYPTLSSLYQGLRENYATKDVLVIPHAHQAGDYRQSDPELENLVEIMSQHGTFEWFGRMYLNHGHRVGFIAASDNHLAQPGYTSPKLGALSQRGGLAAVRAANGSRDTLFDAMKSLSAYAVTGDRIILDVTVNNGGMGQQIKFAKDRIIQGRVVGTTPIDSIVLMKNDREIWRKDYLTRTAGPMRSRETFQVSFESESFPMHPNDNPRGTRGWRGTLEVIGAQLVDFSGTDFVDAETNLLEQDTGRAGLIRFRTGSRGDASSIRMTLADIGPDARILFHLDEARETGSPTRYRSHKLLPAATAELRFDDLEKGMTRTQIPVDVYNDTITLRRIREHGPDEVSFYVKDTGEIQGDYYYVRVRQTNEALAWSSPIWVGGFPSR